MGVLVGGLPQLGGPTDGWLAAQWWLEVALLVA